MADTVAFLPTLSLVTSKANVRKHPGDIGELKESIRAFGVLQPILVRPMGNGQYEVVAGARRVTAARELGLPTVPAIICDLDNSEAIIASLTENIQRNNLEVDEEGEAYKRLITVYGSVSRVARMVNKSERHIHRILDAYDALLHLRSISSTSPSAPVPTVTARPTPEEREKGLALPPRHASALQAAFMAVRDQIPADRRDSTYLQLATVIAQHSEEDASRILREFKLYPDDPIDEIVSRALAPTEVHSRLTLSTARELEQVARERRVRPDDVVEEAIRTYLAAQEAIREFTPGEQPPKPDTITEALELYVRVKQREMLARQQQEEIRKKAQVVQRAPSRRANDLDGATWTRYSISVWNDIRKSAEELALDHPAIFPVMLAERLIQCFTTSEEKVILDPMAGVGSTIIAAKRLGKIGIGVELSEEYVRVAWERLEKTDGPGEGAVYVGDANRLLNFVDPGTVDFGVTSPPYWDILTQERTADGKPVQNYVDREGNLGAIADYGEFLRALQQVYDLVYQTLKAGAYFCVVVMDVRKGDRLYPLHSDLARAMQEIGFLYDDLIIWDRRQEYNNLRPLGYPSVFRINRIHEYILIFRRPEQ